MKHRLHYTIEGNLHDILGLELLDQLLCPWTADLGQYQRFCHLGGLEGNGSRFERFKWEL